MFTFGTRWVDRVLVYATADDEDLICQVPKKVSMLRVCSEVLRLTAKAMK